MQLLNYLLEDTDQRWKNKGTLHNRAKVNSSQGLVKSPSPPANLKSKEKMTENWKQKPQTIRLPAPPTKFLLSHRLNLYEFSCANQAAQERCFHQDFRDRHSPQARGKMRKSWGGRGIQYATLLNRIRNSCQGSNSATASQNLLTCPQLLVSQFTVTGKKKYYIYILEYWPKVTKREQSHQPYEL